MLSLPQPLIENRMFACRKCTAELHDFSNPCAACPNGNWGPLFCNEESVDAILNAPSVPQENIKLAQKAKNFITATRSEIESILHGVPKISQEIALDRLSICKQCEFFKQENETCKKCGCFMKWKTAWRSQKCPIGKW